MTAMISMELIAAISRIGAETHQWRQARSSYMRSDSSSLPIRHS